MSLTVANGNPIVVTGTATSAETILAPAGKAVKIVQLWWLQPTTAGHKLTLTDANGNEIITLRCETDNESVLMPIDSYYDAIVCTDMDSGKLYIYVR